MVRNQNKTHTHTQNVPTSIKAYKKKTLTTSYDKNGFISIVLENYQSREKLVQERGTSCMMICIYNNKEHNGWLIDQEAIVVRTYPVRWNAPNRRAVVQPRMQISKL